MEVKELFRFQVAELYHFGARPVLEAMKEG